MFLVLSYSIFTYLYHLSTALTHVEISHDPGMLLSSPKINQSTRGSYPCIIAGPCGSAYYVTICSLLHPQRQLAVLA
ncbi:hypothetical protein V8E53_014035 [Lactarius tabidus]